MDNIFASKFGIPEVTRIHCTSLHHDEDDPLSVSSKQLTEFYDAVNPVDDKHPQRLNDIDVLNSVKDPDLKNAMLVALSKQSDDSEIDTSGMTDEEIAETALPQNLTYGQLYDAMQEASEYLTSHEDELSISEPSISEPSPSAVPEPAPTQTV